MDKKIAIIIDANGQATVGELDNVTGAFQRLGEEGEKAGQRAGRGAGDIDKATKKWEESGKAIGIVAGTLLGAATAIIGYQAKVADETGKMAERLGVSTQFISEMGFAAKRVSGVDLRGFEDALGTLGDQAAKAEQGMKRPAAAFKSLGIDVTDAHGKMKSLEQLLPEVANKFEQMQDGPREAAIATALFGSEGKKLLPLLNQGADGMAQWRQRAVELGLSLSQETTKGAAELTDNVGLLHVAVQGMVNGWIKDALPAMVAVSGHLAEDAAQTAKTGQSFTALGLIIKTLATAYFFLETVVKDVVNVVAAAVGTLTLGIRGAGSTISTWFKGVTGAVDALIHGDLKGAFNAFSGMMTDFKANGVATVSELRASWSSAIDGIGLSQEDFSRKVSDVWMPAAAGVKSSSEQATGAVDGLGDGFLGLGGKADDAAKKSQRAVDQLAALLDKLRPKAAVSEVDQENAAYAVVLKRIDALEQEAGAMAKLASVQADLTEARRLALDIHEKQLRAAQAADAEHARELDILGQVQDYYREQIRLSGLSEHAYRVETQVIKARNDMLEKGREWTPEMEAQVRATAELGETQLDIADAAKRAAEDYQQSWLNAVQSVGSALGDWITGTISSLGDLGDALEDIGKRWFSDRFSQGFTQLLNGGYASAGGAGGGGFMNFVSNLFGMGSGGGSAASSAGSWIGAIGRMFGFGGGAATATAAGTGWATAASQLLGGAGTLSMGGSAFTASGAAAAASGGGAGMGAAAGSAGLGAASSVAWVPIVGWILAGMIASDSAFKSGWRVDGQKNDMVKQWAKIGFLPGMIDTAVVGGADQLLRSLGVSDRWAAILSGSSLMTKALGHQAPKVKQQGIEGTFGFGGFTGQSWADIVAKGGWFRSDKKWTDTAAINPQIDAAFDQLAHQMQNSALDLAKQLGIDVTSALGKVKLSLGKLTLDSDPEKAAEQLQQKMAEMTQQLSAAAVRSLGFGGVLDGAFQPSDVMSALAASIGLVTGGAQELNRALNADELMDVANATKYFENVAKDTGEALGDVITRVAGGLSDYGNLIGGVRSELLTHGLSQYAQAQVQIELQYRAQVKQANDLAKALGLSGARAEDLASIEQLRAQRMADLQIQMEKQRDQFLGGLRLSDLGIGTDQSKLTDAMGQLRSAVAGGDLQQAQQLAQSVLGFGRNLYASGSDYNALYGTVTGLLNGLDPASSGLSDSALQHMADTLDTMPQDIASALFQTLYSSQGGTLAPPPPTASTPAPGTGSGGSSGTKPPHGPLDPLATEGAVAALVEVASNTRELLRLSKRTDLKAPA